MGLLKWLDESLGRLDNKVVGAIVIAIGLWFGFLLLMLGGTQLSSSLRATLSVPPGGGVTRPSPSLVLDDDILHSPSPSLPSLFCTTSDDCLPGSFCNQSYECEEGCFDDSNCGLLEYCERPDVSEVGDCLLGCGDDFSCPVGKMCEEHKCVEPPKCLEWVETCSLITYDHRPPCCNLRDGYEFDQYCNPRIDWVVDEKGEIVERRSETWGQCEPASPTPSVEPSPTRSPSGSPLPSGYPTPLPLGPIPT